MGRFPLLPWERLAGEIMTTTMSSPKESAITMTTKHAAVRLAIIALSVQLTGCSKAPDNTPTIDACVQNGIAYYKEIGSYPTLTSAGMAGRRADDVAAEMCSRSTQAFPSKR